MRKVGKFEKVPQKAPEKAPRKDANKAPQKKVLLQTYFTSLLSLVLCVTMFFGTTAAWFTDTVEVQKNELLAGTMEVELKHASVQKGKIGTPMEVTEDYKILDNTTKWEPGYTAIEQFQVIEKGDLAFTYEMKVKYAFSESTPTKEKAVAKAITVFTYFGTKTDTLPKDYEDMCKTEGWEPIGTLYDVIDKKLPVFSGKMDEATVSADAAGKATHMIALHMDEAYGNDKDDINIQGTSLEGITITLVAHQMPSESDAFGTVYDRHAVNYTAARTVEVKDGKLVNNLTITMTDYRTAVPSVVTNLPANTAVSGKNLTLTIKEQEIAAISETVVPTMILKMELSGLAAGNTDPMSMKLQLADKPAAVTAVYLDGEPLAAGAYNYEASGELTLNVAKLGTFAIVY